MERLTSVSHHIAELVNLPPDPQEPYVGVVGVRPQGRAAHVGASPAGPTPTSTSTPTSVGNGTRFLVSELAGKATIELKAKELGLELDGAAAAGGGRRAQAARARGLPLRGGRRLARAAHARGHRLGAGLLRARVVPGHDVPPQRVRSDVPIEDGESMIDTEATVKVRVDDERHRRHRRGQRPGQRPRRRAAGRARRALPGARAHPPHRLQGPGARHRPRPPARSPGCSSTPPTATAPGPPSASARTSSRPSWQALVDSLVFGLLHTARVTVGAVAALGVRPRQADRWPLPIRARCSRRTTPRCVRVAAAAARVVAGRPAGRARDGGQPRATRLGNQGPDQGYALKLAPPVRRASSTSTEGEHREDADGRLRRRSALKRASLFGRAPVIHDLTRRLHGLGLPRRRRRAELVELRQPLFEEVRQPAPLPRAAGRRRRRARGHACA